MHSFIRSWALGVALSPPLCEDYISPSTIDSFTYDHRILRIAHPVCSAVLKQDTGGLVVRWVTTGEYPLLYVFDIFVMPRVIINPTILILHLGSSNSISMYVLFFGVCV